MNRFAPRRDVPGHEQPGGPLPKAAAKGIGGEEALGEGREESQTPGASVPIRPGHAMGFSACLCMFLRFLLSARSVRRYNAPHVRKYSLHVRFAVFAWADAPVQRSSPPIAGFSVLSADQTLKPLPGLQTPGNEHKTTKKTAAASLIHLPVKGPHM